MPINADLMKTISTGFKALFTETFNNVQSEAEILATRVNSTDLQETYPWLGDIPDMIEWVGDRTVKELSSYEYTIVNKKYESTVKVDAKYIEYDKAGLFAPAIKMMAENAKKFGSKLIVDLILNGDTNLAYDGVAFFGTHTVGVDNYTNRSTLTLTEDNLNAAYDFMLSIKNENGRGLGVKPNLLVVGPALRATANKLLNLDNQGTNSTYKLLDLLVIPDISGTNWYLFDTTKAIKPFILQVAEEGTFEANASAEQLFMSDSMLYGTKSFMNAGYSLWQLAYHSTGTGV